MANEWIMDVLADLRTFARQNDLPALAEQLEDSALVAAAEITSQERRQSPRAVAYGRRPGTLDRTAASS